MTRQLQYLCFVCGPLVVLLDLLGWVVLGGFLPPLTPTSTPAEVTGFYAADPVRIGIGMILFMFGMSMLGPFGLGHRRAVAPDRRPDAGVDLRGIIAFYIPALLFFVWIVIVSWYGLRAVARSPHDGAAA